MLLPLLWMLAMVVPSAAPAPPDTLVVCPAVLRPALAPWKAHRESQGHTLRVVDAPRTAAGVRAAVARAYREGALKYVVLVGDVAADRGRGYAPIVPTEYVPARVNVRWGSEPTIATDQLYADVDGDRLPDVAVGRIPADSPDELATFVHKVIGYERQAACGPWQRQIEVVAGVGGFGALADVLIEAAGRRVFQELVPAGYQVRATLAGHTGWPGQVQRTVERGLSGGCLAWVYLGHGLPTELDYGPTLRGRAGGAPGAGDRPILSVDDVTRLRGGAESPLAVLVACYTGALDAPRDCLAEELALAGGGPVAVVAATRVSMPYGNAALGCELLRSCFDSRYAVLGDAWREAQRRTIADDRDDRLRVSLDTLARALTPLPPGESPGGPVDLAAERQEHVWMYQLMGDPLLRLWRPHGLKLRAPCELAADEALHIEVDTTVGGQCVVELVEGDGRFEPRGKAPAAAGQTVGGGVLATTVQRVEAGRVELALGVPADAAGRCTVRVFISGREAAALGATKVVVRRRAVERISRADDAREVR